MEESLDSVSFLLLVAMEQSKLSFKFVQQADVIKYSMVPMILLISVNDTLSR